MLNAISIRLFYLLSRAYSGCLWLAVGIPFTLSAQQANTMELLHSLKELNEMSISYEYQVSLVNHKTGAELDKVNGRLFKLNDAYLDSNTSGINLRDRNYILQINSAKKVAYVKSIKNIEALAKRRLSSEPAMLFDMRLIKPENIIGAQTNKDDQGNTIISLSLSVSSISDLIAVVTGDGTLKRLTIKMVHYSQNARLDRVLTMEGFNSNVSAGRIDVRNYLSQSGSRIVLKGKYAKYKLVQLV